MKLTKPAMEAIQEYLSSVAQFLAKLPEDERQGVLRQTKEDIVERLKAQGAADPVDADAVKAVLVKMDPPELYENILPAEHPAPSAPPVRRGGNRTLTIIISAAVVVALGIGAAMWWHFSGVTTAMGTVLRQRTPEQLAESGFVAREKWDTEALVLLMKPDYQEGTRLLTKLTEKPAEMKAAYLDLADAMEKAYKKPQEDLRKRAETLSGPMDQVKAGMQAPVAGVCKNGKVDWSKVKVKVHGDRGRIEIPSAGDSTDIIKVDGKWYEDASRGGPPPEAFIEQFKGQVEKLDVMIAKLKDLAAKVKSGELTEQQLASRLMEFANTGPAPTPSNSRPSQSRPEPPPEIKVTDLKSALQVLKSDDVFRQGDAVAWLDKAKITAPADHETICATAKALLTRTDVPNRPALVRLLCQHAAEKELPDLIAYAGSQDGNEWQPALAGLFRLAPKEGRTVVQHRATDWDVRRFAADLFRKSPDKYTGDAALLLSAPNPDLQRDMLDVLTQIGGEESMQPLRDYKAGLPDSAEAADLYRRVDHALQLIRQRLVDHGKKLPPEPETDYGKLGQPKNLDQALAALTSRNPGVGIDWLEKATLDQDEDIKKARDAVAAAYEAAQGNDKYRLRHLLVKYAGVENISELITIASDEDRGIAIEGVMKLLLLDPVKGHKVVVARSADNWWPGDLFRAFGKDATNYEDEGIKCIWDPALNLRIEAIQWLGRSGTAKGLDALKKLKPSLNAKKDERIIGEVDRAVSAIEVRLKLKEIDPGGTKPPKTKGKKGK